MRPELGPPGEACHPRLQHDRRTADAGARQVRPTPRPAGVQGPHAGGQSARGESSSSCNQGPARRSHRLEINPRTAREPPLPGLISRQGPYRHDVASRSRTRKSRLSRLPASSRIRARLGNEHVLALDGSAGADAAGQFGLNALVHGPAFRHLFRQPSPTGPRLGREPGRIQVYARDGKSGTYDTFNSLVLKPRKRELAPDARRFESSEELSDSVARDPNGIGFAGFAYMRNAKALEVVNDCGIAHEPSVFNVKTEQYPLSRRLYLYTNAVPKGSLAERIVEFVLSPAAQDIIRAHGFIDQNIELSDQNDQVLRLADGLIALEPAADPALLKELASSLKYSAAPVDDAAIPAELRRGSTARLRPTSAA